MMAKKRFTFAACLLGAWSCAHVLAAQQAVPIAPERIRAAILARHPGLGGLRPLVQPVSRAMEPVLVPGPVEPWAGGRVRVLVRCQQAEDCVPFFVEGVLGGATNDAPTADPIAQKSVAPVDQAQVTPRPGARVTLLIDSGHLHVSMPVTLLSTAPVGGQVRVQMHPAPLSPDSHPQARVLLATVVDARTVRGTLQ